MQVSDEEMTKKFDNLGTMSGEVRPKSGKNGGVEVWWSTRSFKDVP